MAYLGVLFTLMLLQARLGLAQQFPFFQLPYDTFNLSSPCFTVLNTTLDSCDSEIGMLTDTTGTVDVLTTDELSSVCSTTCRGAMNDLRSKIQVTCDAKRDVIVYEHIAYPATFIVDKYLYTYDVSCFKDKSTGAYCDQLILDSRNSSTSLDGCSDCVLGVLQLQLGSPVGYTDDLATEFASATSSCQATGYAYTSPGPYALNSSAPIPSTTATATPTTTSMDQQPTCTSIYTVSGEDTCESIAEKANVSTYGLIDRNGLDVFCSELSPGQQLCLPQACATHILVPGDTCDSLASSFKVSVSQLKAWNPIFDGHCLNVERWYSWNLCVGPPGGFISTPPPNTAVDVPSNAMPGSTRECAQWHEVVVNDTCLSIIPSGSSLTLEQFLYINTDIKPDCSNLLLGQSYCVKPVKPVELPATTTFAQPPPSTSAPIVIPSPTLNPRAPGTIDGCATYQDYTPSPSDIDPISFPPANWTILSNTCAYVAQQNGVTVQSLIEWNPSLTQENCTLASGYSYCVVKTAETTTATFPTTTLGGSSSAATDTATSSTTGQESSSTAAPSTSTNTSPPVSTTSTAAPPAQTQPGVIDSCKKFHTVASGDTCYALSQEYGISLDQFYEWNPTVGTDCRNLWLGYDVCVGI